MKLEAKHLAPYLPYNLQVEYRGKVTTLDALDTTGGAFVGENRMVSFVNQRHIKPILRPMTNLFTDEFKDLRDDISEYELDVIFTWFVSELKPTNPLICISYYVATLLFEHHFDVFNLIENNLAINKTKM